MVQIELDFTDTEAEKAAHPTKCGKCGEGTRVYSLETVYCPACKQVYDYREKLNRWITRGLI